MYRFLYIKCTLVMKTYSAAEIIKSITETGDMCYSMAMLNSDPQQLILGRHEANFEPLDCV